MENKIMQDFENASQRLLYSYIALTPEFRSIKSDIADESSQKQMYDFLIDFYHSLYNNPEILGLETIPDETEDKRPKGRSYLDVRKVRRKNRDKIEFVLDQLRLIGEYGYVKGGNLHISKANVNITGKKLKNLIASTKLSMSEEGDEFIFTSNEYPDMVNGWKLLSIIASQQSEERKCEAQKHIFRRALFDSEYMSGLEVIGRLANDKNAFDKLFNYTINKGFKCEMSTEDGFNQIDLQFSKKYYDKENNVTMLVGPWVTYQRRNYSQLEYGLLNDKNIFKVLFKRFDTIEESTKELIVKHFKKCKECGFCNQMNKNHPLAYALCNFNGETYKLCTMFQGICTSLLDESLVNRIIDFYKFIDREYEAVE